MYRYKPWVRRISSISTSFRWRRHSHGCGVPRCRRHTARADAAAVVPGGFVHVAATARPCRTLGGDFYDYVDTGREFHVLLGDACGKGTPAALQAAMAQGVLAVEVEARTGAANVVARLNRALCRRGMADRFVTLFYGVMTHDHRFTYCNAGHCLPMLVDQSSVRRLCVGGVPPGLFGDAVYQEESLRIKRARRWWYSATGFPRPPDSISSLEMRAFLRSSRRTPTKLRQLF